MIFAKLEWFRYVSDVMFMGKKRQPQSLAWWDITVEIQRR